MEAESGLADAVRAIKNLATAQVRKDTPSLIDVKGLGCPKAFTGREEDLQQWSKKTEVIKESDLMLEWAAEQPTEITTTAIDLEFLPTDANEDRGVQNLEFVLQQMHTADDRRKKTKPSAHDHFSWTVLSSGTPSGDRTLGVLRVSQREEDEGQVGRMRSNLLVLSRRSQRNLRNI